MIAANVPQTKMQKAANVITQRKPGNSSVSTIVDNRPQAIAQLQLQAMANNSPRVQQLKAYHDMADKRISKPVQPAQLSSYGQAGKTTRLNVAYSNSSVIQRVKLKNQQQILATMNESGALSHLTGTQKDSVIKELPNWYSKTKGQRFATVEFTPESLSACVTEMISTVDEYTDTEGQGLTDKINHTQESPMLVGYRATGQNKPGAIAAMPFGGVPKSQIGGNGLYIAKDRSIAEEYLEQYVIQGMIGILQAVYIDIEKIEKTLLIKGISVKEWWDHYDENNDATYDIIVAAISGKINTIQYKVSPKHLRSGIFIIKEISRMEPPAEPTYEAEAKKARQ